MIETPVPDYFQEETDEALRLQLGWMQEHLGLENEYFAELLGLSDRSLLARHAGLPHLTDSHRATLRGLWRSMLHLLSFLGNDCQMTRTFLNWVPPAVAASHEAALTPPWSGSSLRHHLQANGARAIDDLNSWVLQFRFGTPCAA